MPIKNVIRKLLPLAISNHMILSGPIRGERIFTSWHDYPAAILGYTERPLLGWFAINVQPGQTWLDIGAHYGFTAIALCNQVRQNGRVFAFEPMLTTAGYLNQTRQVNSLSQLVVLPLGLSSVVKMSLQLLPVVRGMVDSTIEKTKAEWFESFLVVSLDELWPTISNDNQKIHGIKIDVQGMEIEVLKGMKDILKTQHPKLAIEVHDGVNRQELLDFLDSVGYSKDASPIEPIEGEEKAQLISNRSYEFSPC